MRPLLLRLAALAAVLALAGCSSGPAPNSAAACELQPSGVATISMMRNVPIMVASIDGTPVRFVLDTGSEWSFLTVQAARRLGLHADPRRVRRAMGVGGADLHYSVTADSFQLADASIEDQVFSVGTLNWQLSGEPPDGFLGSDVLSTFDVDLDLPDGRMALYRARDCDRATPPWDWPYTVLPLRPAPSGIRLFGVPMRLDGQQVTATLDTGSEFTTVATSTARALGITGDMLERDRPISVFGFGPHSQVSRIHVFSEIGIADQVQHNVQLIVADLPPLSGDMLLGFNFLARQRVYLSYATERMFLSLAQFPRATVASADLRR